MNGLLKSKVIGVTDESAVNALPCAGSTVLNGSAPVGSLKLVLSQPKSCWIYVNASAGAVTGKRRRAGTGMPFRAGVAVNTRRSWLR